MQPLWVQTLRFDFRPMASQASDDRCGGESGSRLRWNGSAHELADTIRPYAKHPSWFVYAEKDGKGTLCVPKLEKHKHMWQKVRRLIPSMCFTQKTVEMAMKNIIEDAGWDMTAAQRKEAAEVFARRFKVGCRHLSQALRKGAKQPKWCARLFKEEMQGSEADEEEADEEDNNKSDDEDDGTLEDPPPPPPLRPQTKRRKTQADSEDWPMWGYDPEQRAAWRAKGYAATDHKELTTDIYAPHDAKDTDPVMARFQDGLEYPLAELTVSAWGLKSAANVRASHARQKSATRNELWTMDLKDGSNLMVKLRKDRHMLVSMYKGQKQICQVPLAAFADESAAVEFLSVRLAHLAMICQSRGRPKPDSFLKCFKTMGWFRRRSGMGCGRIDTQGNREGVVRQYDHPVASLPAEGRVGEAEGHHHQAGLAGVVEEAGARYEGGGRGGSGG